MGEKPSVVSIDVEPQRVDVAPKGKRGKPRGTGWTKEKLQKVKAASVDWEKMFLQWIASDMPLERFLVGVGLQERGKPMEPEIHHHVKDWGALRSSGLNPQAAKAEWSDQMGVARIKRIDEPPTPDSWAIIQGYRRNQSLSDFRTGEILRNHLKLILARSFGKDDAGQHTSTLKPTELRHLSLAALDIQRIQRLALGLSTENVGIDDPNNSAQGMVEKNVTPSQPDVPTFEVVMSKRGKFMTARPRRIN